MLRVLTFNIKHGSTMKGDFDLDHIASVIRRATPDLVALQEVDIGTERARGMDLLAEFSQRTGMHPAFAPAMTFGGGEYGNGVLSRFPITAIQPEPLPHTDGNEPRTALAVELTHPDHGPLRFISTHLDFESEADRLAQAAFLNQEFAPDALPTVLAGDFNATPESRVIAILNQRWIVACGDNPAPTFPSDAPEIKIDYVFYRPAEAFRVLATRVIQDAVASDHCAYLVELDHVGQ